MVKKNKHRGGNIPPAIDPKDVPSKIPNQPHRTLDEKVSADELNARVSFQLFDDYECISSWPADDCKELVSSLKRFCNSNWRSIKSTGGKSGTKVGFGYTTFDKKSSLKRKWPHTLSEDLSMAEVRVGGTKRIFGVRHESTFYVVWLDRKHLICP